MTQADIYQELFKAERKAEEYRQSVAKWLESKAKNAHKDVGVPRKEQATNGKL